MTYYGILPTNYNIIIKSPTNYGQLSVTSATGSMAFGIYPSSHVYNGTYTAVLQGFDNLNQITGTSGTFNGGTYKLVLDGNNYDLIFKYPAILSVLLSYSLNPPINQITAAQAVDNSSGLTELFDTYSPLTGQDLINALNSISAEPYADNQTVGLQFLRRQSDLLLGSAGDNCQDAKKNYCGFVLGGKNVGSINGQNGLASFNSAVVNTIYGVEWNPNKKWSLGLAYGYGTTNLSNYTLDAVNITGNVNSGSIYGVYKPNSQWKISALFDYSNFNYQGSRYIAVAIASKKKGEGYAQ